MSSNHYTFPLKGGLILELDLKRNKDLIQKESSEVVTTK